MRGRLLHALVALAAPSLACAGSAPLTTDAAADRAPAPDARDEAPASCPPSPPRVDAGCAVAAGVTCGFGDPCSFSRYACEDGRWVATVKDGAAPEACPGSAPSTGSTCASCGASFRCTYAGACGAVTTSVCSGGHWLTGTSPCDAGAATDAREGGPG